VLQSQDPEDLKKEMHVKFRGEEGLDYGGVKKEWFQLVVQAVFDPMYGMFMLDPKTRAFWFSMSSDSYADFRLVGMLLGLSVYNSVILDLHFPSVVYKKLKGITPTFADLHETHPDVHSNLAKLLQLEGDIEALALTFSVEYDRYGAVVTHDLVANGSQIAVTRENREEYVRLYTKFLLVDSIAKQFGEFRNGFDLLCNSDAFNLFIAEELDLVICGSSQFDWNELEKATKYDGGYSESHPTVRAFWSMFHRLPQDQKKLFLKFATGSDRCPVGGLGALRLVIARNGPDSDKLPTASTCFNALLLPEYTTPEKMERLLLTAIQNCEGFGLL
jgi:ubiquitin-protein ligase E3 A